MSAVAVSKSLTRSGTRTPVTHRVHVGVDGFFVTPTTPMVGEGPGVLEPPGETKTYGARNRWSVNQLVTVHADVPWIRVNNEPGPVDVTLNLPPGKSKPVTIAVDASGINPPLDPDVYVSEVTWKSQDSGSPDPDPEPDDVRTVRMDLCRQIYGQFAPASLTLGPDETESVFVTVNAAPGHHVEDVDVAVFLAVNVQQGGASAPNRLRLDLVHPDGDAQVKLGERLGSLGVIYDDDTFPPEDCAEAAPEDCLEAFNTELAAGDWELRAHWEGTQTVQVTISRLEVRLHTTEALSCPL